MTLHLEPVDEADGNMDEQLTRVPSDGLEPGQPLIHVDSAGLIAIAVVNVRFATSSVTAGAAELYAYGTAVVLV